MILLMLLLLLCFVILCYKLKIGTVKKRIALYTIITGDYESHVREKFPLKMMPMLEAAYVVTDCRFIEADAKKKGWDCIFVNKSENSKKTQRKMKVLQNFHPDLHMLNEYDIIIYIDGNCGLSSIPKLENAINEVHKHDIICFDHPVRKTSKAELETVLNLKLISKDAYVKVKTVFEESKYPDNIGLSETRVLLRNNNDNVNQFCTEWINNMMNAKCYRDQIFFEYALWKHKTSFKRMKNDDFPFETKGGHYDKNRMRTNIT